MSIIQADAESPVNLAQPFRRESSHSKKKAARAECLTSESLQSVYDAAEISNGGDDKCQKDNCPKSERFCTSNKQNIKR